MNTAARIHLISSSVVVISAVSTLGCMSAEPSDVNVDQGFPMLESSGLSSNEEAIPRVYNCWALRCKASCLARHWSMMSPSMAA
jgi:hypothetical protein